jgi:hypothetical protein
MRKLYLKQLSVVDETVDIDHWDKKIYVFNWDDDGKTYPHRAPDKTNVTSEKKVILFYVSVSSVYTYGERAIDKLHQVMDVFAESSDKITVRWVVDPKFDDDMNSVCSSLKDRYLEIVDVFLKRQLGEYIVDAGSDLFTGCDAYYGSGGYYLNQCVNRGLPTMIWNPEI